MHIGQIGSSHSRLLAVLAAAKYRSLARLIQPSLGPTCPYNCRELPDIGVRAAKQLCMPWVGRYMWPAEEGALQAGRRSRSRS